MERIPASERTRERLKALMDGSGESAGGSSDLVRLAARLIIEEALEGEARVGRPPALATATAIGLSGSRARRGPSTTARRRSPTAGSRFTRRFAGCLASAPRSWRD